MSVLNAWYIFKVMKSSFTAVQIRDFNVKVELVYKNYNYFYEKYLYYLDGTYNVM